MKDIVLASLLQVARCVHHNRRDIDYQLKHEAYNDAQTVKLSKVILGI